MADGVFGAGGEVVGIVGEGEWWRWDVEGERRWEGCEDGEEEGEEVERALHRG